MLIVTDLQFLQVHSGLAKRSNEAEEGKGKEAAASKGCSPLPGSRHCPQLGVHHIMPWADAAALGMRQCPALFPGG